MTKQLKTLDTRAILIDLPFIRINLLTNIEAGSVRSLKDLPIGVFDITSANSDTTVRLYYHVKPGEVSAETFNEQYMYLKIVEQLTKVFQEFNLFGERPQPNGDVIVQFAFDDRDNAKEEVAIQNGLGITAADFKDDTYQITWAITEGVAIAKNMLLALSMGGRPHPSHTELNIHHMRPGDLIGDLCMQAPHDMRVHGKLYFDYSEKKKLSGIAAMVGGLGETIINMMEKDMSENPKAAQIGKMMGIDPAKMRAEMAEKTERAVKLEDEDKTVRVDFERNGKKFTAFLDIPFADEGSHDWLDLEAIGAEVNQAITNAINETVNFLGLQ